MKNFPNTKARIETSSIINSDEVSNVLHVEWNLNKYITNPELAVNDTIPTGAAYTEINQDAAQIKRKFPIESVVAMNRSNLSSYIIAGTRYRTEPEFVNQRARTDASWQDDTTWLWWGNDIRYKYWTTCLKADNSGVLPYNVGNITYTWEGSKPMNKLRILFQKDNAFPTSWTIYLDLAGDQTWTQVASNPTVPASGKLDLYRKTVGQSQLGGTWTTTKARWSTELDNRVECYGIKIVINNVDTLSGRPAIIEISPRFEADLTEYMTSWQITEETDDQDFIAPLGVASANTGSVVLSNDTGLFNEHDSEGMLYRMMDEEVEFRGYLNFNQDLIPMFTMLSDSWDAQDYDPVSIQLVDKARRLQNTESKDMVIPNVTAGTALHMLFAAIGLEQFDLVEVTPKETPALEKFYTKKEEKVWEVIQDVCKGLQMAAFFDATGTLKVYSRDAMFNPDASPTYEFSTETRTDRVPDIFSMNREENARFNKVTIRYNAINDFTISGGQNQLLWKPPETWTIGAAQIVANIGAGHNYFMIDPNRPEDMPFYSGTVVIDGINNEFEFEGKDFYCKNAPDGSKYITAKKPSDYQLAVENNRGEAPKFTGKLYLKDGKTFEEAFGAKNYQLNADWDMIVHQLGSDTGTRVATSGKHEPKKGCLVVTTNYTGSRRLDIYRKSKDWNRFDRVGIKFKAEGESSKTGVIIWPQGNLGVAGYYFMVDPMTTEEVHALKRTDDPGIYSGTKKSPGINGFVVRTNGNASNLEVKEYDVNTATRQGTRDISMVRVGKWAYLEVAVYPVQGGHQFEVFIDGQYCKTYVDKTVNLSRNERAGMTFTGVGDVSVERFYVVNYPADAVKESDQDDSGFIVRRKDLWTDRKSSGGDHAFHNYIKMLEKHKKTQVFEYPFSGRFNALVRQKLTETIRFEQPALTAHFKMSNPAIAVLSFEPTSWGARYTLLNKAERYQMMNGTIETKHSGAEHKVSSYIYGKSFWFAEPQEIEYKKDASIDRIGPLPIEFESKWIQDHATADDLAKWVMNRFGENAEVYSLEVFGNPLIEPGDIVSVEWPQKGFDDSITWVVSKVENEWSNGLNTNVTIRRIIP